MSSDDRSWTAAHIDPAIREALASGMPASGSLVTPMGGAGSACARPHAPRACESGLGVRGAPALDRQERNAELARRVAAGVQGALGEHQVLDHLAVTASASPIDVLAPERLPLPY